MNARSLDELEAQLDEIRRSPVDGGVLRLIVRRPALEERELVETAELDVEHGLVGDSWRVRGSKATADGSADPEAQITLMNARLAAAIAGPPDAWGIAGDQLYVDLDVSEANLPSGARIAIGEAVLEDLGHAPHGLRQVQRALRPGRAEVRQHPAGSRSAVAWREHADRARRDDPGRRSGGQGRAVILVTDGAGPTGGGVLRWLSVRTGDPMHVDRGGRPTWKG